MNSTVQGHLVASIIDLNMKKGDIRRQADLAAEISDQMGLIDITLAPIKQFQKLSNSTFATSQPEQIVQFTVDLVNELKRVRNDLKSLCNSIEHLSDDFYIPATPCLATEIKDLKCKIGNFVTTKPEPLDYSKLYFTEPIA